jgi:hypothetical protein
MNTDDSVIMDYRDALPPQSVAEVRRLIPDVDDEVFERFIEPIRFPISACRAELRAHQMIPDAKDEDRCLKKPGKKLDRLSNLAAEVSTLLDEAPFGLRKAARRADSGRQLDFSTSHTGSSFLEETFAFLR